MTDAVAYMRCSGLGDGTDTWERQLEAIYKFCDAHEYRLVRDYREDYVPGKLDREDRPAFQKMVAEMGTCKVIVIERLDRLARRYLTQESLITFIFGAGYSLFAADTGENVTDAMMGDPMRRALVQIQGIFSELDKNMLIFKLRKARERIRAANGRCEGRLPYGTLPGEAEVVAQILSLDRSGLGPNAIADYLNTRQVPTRLGKSWHSGTISKIIERQENTDAVLQDS